MLPLCGRPLVVAIQVLHEMFFRALTLDRAREYSVPWIEENLHRKLFRTLTQLRTKTSIFPHYFTPNAVQSWYSLSRLRIHPLSRPNLTRARAARHNSHK